MSEKLTPEEQVQAIKWWQHSSGFHPMTCGVSSRHAMLVPEVDEAGVVSLVCPTCDYRQAAEHIPRCVFDAWQAREASGGKRQETSETMDTAKVRECSYLLPDPGGEVVRDLLHEIERLRITSDQCGKLIDDMEDEIERLVQQVAAVTADRDRYERRFGDYGNKLAEWQQETGHANPSRAGEELRRLRKRVADLGATVERFPKTADGVPVVPWMKLYARGTGTEFVAQLIDENGDSNRFHGFYSTREAAKAGGES